MTLLEAAKSVAAAWAVAASDADFDVIPAVVVTAMNGLDAAIAAEEANPSGYCSDGRPWYDHAVDERVRRVAAEKERDELRAKLAAMERAEPVAYATGVFCGRFTYRCVNPALVLPDGAAFYTHPAPAYTPMTDEELYNAERDGEVEWVMDEARHELVDSYRRRAIERAVLARLGVTP